MLTDPNVDSPANIDAAVRMFSHCCLAALIQSPIYTYVYIYIHIFTCAAFYTLSFDHALRFQQKMFRENPKEFRKMVSRCVERSQEMAP